MAIVYSVQRWLNGTCLFVGDFDGVGLEGHDGAAAARVERRNLDEELLVGFEVSDPQVWVATAFVVQQHCRLRVEDLELELLRMAAVETRSAPHFHRIGRLVQHRTVGWRLRSNWSFQKNSHFNIDLINDYRLLFIRGLCEPNPYHTQRHRK